MLLQLDALMTALLIALFLLLLTTLLPWLISVTTSKSKVVKEEPIELVGCPKCGYESSRKYEKGDYVGKVVGTCPKDSSFLIVKAIYVEKHSYA
ncbi:MAG: hypothetical protein QW780_03985 [Sulfolobales archaeon]